LTVHPRNAQTKVGKLYDIRIRDITARAENSARISGCPESPVTDVRLENVTLTMDRWTQYPGGVWDNRPGGADNGIERHATPGFAVRHARNVSLTGCSVVWGSKVAESFTSALEAEQAPGLALRRFSGTAAHPDRDPDIAVK
jgi:hypothetical protein